MFFFFLLICVKTEARRETRDFSREKNGGSTFHPLPVVCFECACSVTHDGNLQYLKKKVFYFESMTTVFILTLSLFILRWQYLASVIRPNVFDRQTGVKSAYKSLFTAFQLCEAFIPLNCDKLARRQNIFQPRPTRLKPHIFKIYLGKKTRNLCLNLTKSETKLFHSERGLKKCIMPAFIWPHDCWLLK